MSDRARGRVIVFGNEKGGTGKSTAAVHVIVGLLKAGHSVASLDLDIRQATLTRYFDNRRRFADTHGRPIPLPDHTVVPPEVGAGPDCEAWVAARMADLAGTHDALVVDTPGNDTPMSRLAHASADVLLTPLNDSFVDLDVLGHVAAESMTIERLSHYAELVWSQRKQRAAAGGKPIDWVVMRNRLSSLDSRSKREIARLLAELSKRIGFRVVPGFGERVIYRELFPKGLTILDLNGMGPDGLRMSDLAARQEVRNLVEALWSPPA
ncbi:MAG: ATPase [Rhodospirillales bacterium]|nr:ATPase [Rhodospirillales bacterium]